MKKFLGIIGGGYWGKNHIRNFYKLGVLHTICDINQETLLEFKNIYPEVNLERDYKKLLGNKEIKAVVVTTPSNLHYSITKDALISGKDVLVEKPLSLTLAEGEELVRLAKEKNRILMVGHILQYHPAILKLKELIDKGKLGKINYIYSNRLNFGKFRTEEDILWSFAPHDISVILYLLKEMPVEVSARGESYLTPKVADVTISTMKFQSGVNSHIFISWLHPYKEQKLIVIGDKKMAVFDDVSADKLVLFSHKIAWVNRYPYSVKEEGEKVKFKMKEPLKLEAQHFLSCIKNRTEPKTCGKEAIRVLKVLESLRDSLNKKGETIIIDEKEKEYFVHPSSIIEKGAKIGKRTKIWHYSHIMGEAEIGDDCSLGQNVFIDNKVKIGNGVKIQNNVSIYNPTVLEDYVFCGPSSVFTNVKNPRAHVERKEEFRSTLVKKGATIGANSTIVCGVTIGKFAFVGAGALVTKDVPDYQIVVGNPAKFYGYACECGEVLKFKKNKAECFRCSKTYKKFKGRINLT